MLPLVQFVAVLATALFAGAATYISFVEHPARMGCSTEIAATVFAPSYARAAVMQASLAIVGSAAGVAAWALGGGSGWLVAALFILAVVPVTLVVIFPTNAQLLAPERDRGSPETRALLVRWGRLHAIRSVLGMAASVIFICQLVGA